MAYNFGQLIYNEETQTFMDKMNAEVTSKKTYSVRYEPTTFDDCCIKLTGGSSDIKFMSGEKYYLRLFVKKRTFAQVGQITLRYFSNSAEEGEPKQIVQKSIVFNIPADKKGQVLRVTDLPTSGNRSGDLYLVGPLETQDEEKYAEYFWSDAENDWINLVTCTTSTPGYLECPIQEFNLTFQPIVSDYDCIVLELDRNPDTVPATSKAKQILLLNYDLEKLRNMLGNYLSSEITMLRQIGVQSYPGLKMCIDGELIEVGRSGIYEVNDGYEIAFIGFIYNEEDRNKPFILDYQY